MGRHWILVLGDTKHTEIRLDFQLFANFITRGCFSRKHWRVPSAPAGVTHNPNFCSPREMRQFVTNATNASYLRVIEVGRCRSLQQRRRDDDSKRLEDRCHVCRARSVLCKRRDNLSGPDFTGGGRTSSLLPPLRAGLREGDRDGCAGHKVAQTEGAVAVVCCLYSQTTATPSLLSHSPPSSLDLCSLLPIPKGVSLPKS